MQHLEVELVGVGTGDLEVRFVKLYRRQKIMAREDRVGRGPWLESEPDPRQSTSLCFVMTPHC